MSRDPRDGWTVAWAVADGGELKLFEVGAKPGGRLGLDGGRLTVIQPSRGRSSTRGSSTSGRGAPVLELCLQRKRLHLLVVRLEAVRVLEGVVVLVSCSTCGHVARSLTRPSHRCGCVVCARAGPRAARRR